MSTYFGFILKAWWQITQSIVTGGIWEKEFANMMKCVFLIEIILSSLWEKDWRGEGGCEGSLQCLEYKPMIKTNLLAFFMAIKRMFGTDSYHEFHLHKPKWFSNS